jgi:predicted dehydrogenase
MTVRTAVIGLGGVSAMHIRKLARLPGVEVAGICDLSRTVAGAVAERDGVGPVFTDHRRLLEAVRPDAVHITTPPHTHRAIACDALAAGAHVLVEKPIATSWDDYVAMRAAADRAGRMLVENHNYLFGDTVRRALDVVRDGRIGDVVTVDVSYGIPLAQRDGPYAERHLPHFAHRMPGGAMQNFATHAAYLTLAFMGDFRDVHVWRTRRTPGALSDDELRALVTGDTRCGVLTLTSHAQPSYCWVLVRGNAGTLELDVYNWRLHVEGAGAGPAKIGAGIRHGVGYVASTVALTARAAASRHDYYQGLERLLAGFYEAIRTGGEPPVAVDDMDRTNRLMAALFPVEAP